MLKKLSLCAVSFLLVLSVMAPISCLALSNVEMKVDIKERSVVVSGNADLKNAEVSVILQNTKKVLPDVVTQVTTDANGDYKFEADFDDLEKGTYEVTVMSESMVEPQKSSVYFDASLIPDEDEPPQEKQSKGGGGGGGSIGSRISAGDVTVVTPQITPPAEIEKTAKDFVDVPEDHWAKASIDKLSLLEIINGTSDVTFEPDRELKREEFAKMLIGALSLDQVDGDLNFTDTDAEAWYYPFVRSAFKYGIIRGISDTEIGIGQKITRQDACTMLLRAIDVKYITLSEEEKAAFSDDAQIADYAKDAVYALYRGGVIAGVSEGEFAPTATLTRAMAAVILDRIMSLGGAGK